MSTNRRADLLTFFFQNFKKKACKCQQIDLPDEKKEIKRIITVH